MPWTCRLLSAAEVARKANAEGLEIGDMWYAPERRNKATLSRQYLRDWADKRDPIKIVLPGPGATIWCVDWRERKDGQWLPDGWTVTGTPPRITVTPSVDLTRGGKYPGRWHGWIRDGVLTAG